MKKSTARRIQVVTDEDRPIQVTPVIWTENVARQSRVLDAELIEQECVEALVELVAAGPPASSLLQLGEFLATIKEAIDAGRIAEVSATLNRALELVFIRSEGHRRAFQLWASEMTGRLPIARETTAHAAGE